jgi:hypothetical protein
MRGAIALAVILAIPVVAHGQHAGVDMNTGAEPMKWGPVPPVLPKGGEIAVLSGDPSKAGPYVLRLKMFCASNYQPAMKSRRITIQPLKT